jgi:hypothetical protein
VEIWAQPGISSVKDIKGRNITVTSTALNNLQYSYSDGRQACRDRPKGRELHRAAH